eukprot:3984197-Alexandrium_andersonii.AAC.1
MPSPSSGMNSSVSCERSADSNGPPTKAWSTQWGMVTHSTYDPSWCTVIANACVHRIGSNFRLALVGGPWQPPPQRALINA